MTDADIEASKAPLLDHLIELRSRLIWSLTAVGASFVLCFAFARQHHLATSQELQSYFSRRVQELVKKHGKTTVGWDEIFAPGLSSRLIARSGAPLTE